MFSENVSFFIVLYSSFSQEYWNNKRITNMGGQRRNKYILLDILVCSIALYFYELCSTKNQNTPKRLIRDLLSNDFFSQNSDLSRFWTSRGREEWDEYKYCYLYSFRALFVLQEAELDNKA